MDLSLLPSLLPHSYVPSNSDLTELPKSRCITLENPPTCHLPGVWTTCPPYRAHESGWRKRAARPPATTPPSPLPVPTFQTPTRRRSPPRWRATWTHQQPTTASKQGMVQAGSHRFLSIFSRLFPLLKSYHPGLPGLGSPRQPHLPLLGQVCHLCPLRQVRLWGWLKEAGRGRIAGQSCEARLVLGDPAARWAQERWKGEEGDEKPRWESNQTTLCFQNFPTFIFSAESWSAIQKGGKARSLGALFRPKDEEKVKVCNVHGRAYIQTKTILNLPAQAESKVMVAIKEVNENELSENGGSPSASPGPHVGACSSSYNLFFLLLSRRWPSPG